MKYSAIRENFGSWLLGATGGWVGCAICRYVATCLAAGWWLGRCLGTWQRAGSWGGAWALGSGLVVAGAWPLGSGLVVAGAWLVAALCRRQWLP